MLVNARNSWPIGSLIQNSPGVDSSIMVDVEEMEIISSRKRIARNVAHQLELLLPGLQLLQKDSPPAKSIVCCRQQEEIAMNNTDVTIMIPTTDLASNLYTLDATEMKIALRA